MRLCYEEGAKWQVSLAFGAPLTVTRREDEAAVLAELERQVHALSQH